MNHGVRKEFLDGTRRHGNYRLPIEKFLRSRLGSLWNDIHSEMSAEFDRRTYAGYRFWDYFGHRWWFGNVALNCWVGAETGTIYNTTDRRVEGFYVHPFTSRLCFQGPEIKEAIPTQSPTRIIIEHRITKKATDRYSSDKFWGRAYEKIDGVWYFTEYRDNEYYVRYSIYPHLYESKPYTITTKRQLNKKELRRLKVTNNTSDEIKAILAERERKIKEEKERLESIQL
jgi:hypothetical protein